jgi:hypothetical protein
MSAVQRNSISDISRGHEFFIEKILLGEDANMVFVAPICEHGIYCLIFFPTWRIGTLITSLTVQTSQLESEQGCPSFRNLEIRTDTFSEQAG